jgi:putative endonuclease
VSTKERGDAAERFAHSVLERQGYDIIEVNARTPLWELDVVAWDQDTLCFVEIRSTESDEFGGPLATVGAAKQRKIVRGASAWLMYHETAPPKKPWPPAVRFDVLGISGSLDDPKVELVKHAFQAG